MGGFTRSPSVSHTLATVRIVFFFFSQPKLLTKPPIAHLWPASPNIVRRGKSSRVEENAVSETSSKFFRVACDCSKTKRKS
jgi:hypothetical protein